MRKLFAVLIILFAIPMAFSYSAQLVTVDQSASRGDPAEFEVLVTDIEETATFRASVSGPHLQRFYVENAKKIEKGENGSIAIEVTPEENAIQQRYGFTVFLGETTGQDFIELSGSYYVSRNRDIRFISVEVPEKAGPGDNISSYATIRSLSGTTLENYRVEMDLFNQSFEETSSPIIPAGERTLRFDSETPFSPPGSFDASFRLYSDDELQQTVNRSLDITELSSVERSTEESGGMLEFERTLSVNNTGNVPENVTLNTSFSSYLSPLTAFSQEPSVTVDEDGLTNYRWDRSLEPGENFTVTANVSYWVPLVFVAVVVASVYGVRKLSRDIEVSKEAEMVDGELKISIRVKNASRNVMEDVGVKEFVPDIADVISEFEMAQPAMKKTSEGTELEWSIGDLSTGETAILQYRVKPRVEVEGGVELRPAEVTVQGEKKTQTGIESVEFSPE